MSVSRSPEAPATAPATEPAPEEPRGVAGRLLRAGVERAVRVQQPLVTAHIAKIREKDPSATPAQVIDALGKRYRLAVAGLGAAGGAVAIVPAVGTAASLATATTEAIAALDAAVLYALAVAEVHKLPVEDLERRRALVLGVVLGEGGAALMSKVTGGKDRWARTVTEAVPLKVLGPLNNSLTRWFVRRYVTRQIALAVGRALPLGLGVAVGAWGNDAVARAVIKAAERAFGPAPTTWPAGSVPPA